MSRPANERHFLKWTLASWKILPRRDWWGGGCFLIDRGCIELFPFFGTPQISSGLYGLGKTCSVAFIASFSWVCKGKGPSKAYQLKGPILAHEEATVHIAALLRRSTRMSLDNLWGVRCIGKGLVNAYSLMVRLQSSIFSPGKEGGSLFFFFFFYFYFWTEANGVCIVSLFPR